MKNVKLIAAAAVLSALSFSSIAAEQVDRTKTVNLDKIGTVSASSAISLSALENQLAAKANAQGASYYYIVSASGNNKVSGTAIIYK